MGNDTEGRVDGTKLRTEIEIRDAAVVNIHLGVGHLLASICGDLRESVLFANHDLKLPPDIRDDPMHRHIGLLGCPIGERWYAAGLVDVAYISNSIPSLFFNLAHNKVHVVTSKAALILSLNHRQRTDDLTMERALDEQRLFQLQRIHSQTPLQARRLAEEIHDPDLRTLALVSLAPDFVSTNVLLATEWLQAGKRALATAANQQSKFRIAAALGSAYLSMKDSARANSFVQDAFHTGISVVEGSMKAEPDQFLYQATGYDELTDIVTLAAKFGRDVKAYIDEIDEVRDSRLRAALLIAVATGLAERERQKE